MANHIQRFSLTWISCVQLAKKLRPAYRLTFTGPLRRDQSCLRQKGQITQGLLGFNKPVRPSFGLSNQISPTTTPPPSTFYPLLFLSRTPSQSQCQIGIAVQVESIPGPSKQFTKEVSTLRPHQWFPAFEKRACGHSGIQRQYLHCIQCRIGQGLSKKGPA